MKITVPLVPHLCPYDDCHSAPELEQLALHFLATGSSYQSVTRHMGEAHLFGIHVLVRQRIPGLGDVHVEGVHGRRRTACDRAGLDS